MLDPMTLRETCRAYRFEARLWFDAEGGLVHYETWNPELEHCGAIEECLHDVAAWAANELTMRYAGLADLRQDLVKGAIDVQLPQRKRLQVMVCGTLRGYFSGPPGEEEWDTILKLTGCQFEIVADKIWAELLDRVEAQHPTTEYPRDILFELMAELDKIAEVDVNKRVDPQQEDSFWLAGNIPATLVARVRTLLQQPVGWDPVEQ